MTVHFPKTRIDPNATANAAGETTNAKNDTSIDVTPPDLPPSEHQTSRHVEKPNRFSLRAMGASMVGRLTVGVAVTGVLLGSLLGAPGATTEHAGVPVEVVAMSTAPRGDQVHQFTNAIGQIGRAIAPDGISRSEVMSVIDRIGFSTTLVEGISPGANGTGLEAEPGTRISVSLNESGFRISASPQMRYHADWAPDPRIRSINYSFANGSFTADAEGIGPDSWFEDGVAGSLNDSLTPHIPSDMRAAGYNPFEDPNLEGKVQSLVDLIVGQATGSDRAADRPGAIDPAFSFGFTVSEEQRIPLQDGAMTAFIEPGTHVNVQTRLDGSLRDPKLEALDISFNRDVGIVRGDDRDAVFSRMDLRRIALRPGGEITLDYRLGPENVADGAQVLIALLAVALQPQAALQGGGPTLQQTRMEGLRAKVQGQIDGELEPTLIDAIRSYDDVLPGFSLAHFFGVDP